MQPLTLGHLAAEVSYTWVPWLKESLHLLFFDSRWPLLSAIATVDSLRGLRVPYILAAEVFCKEHLCHSLKDSARLGWVGCKNTSRQA